MEQLRDMLKVLKAHCPTGNYCLENIDVLISTILSKNTWTHIYVTYVKTVGHSFQKMKMNINEKLSLMQELSAKGE